MQLQQYINFQLLIVNLKLQRFQEPIINLDNYGLTDDHLKQLLLCLTGNEWCLENLEQLQLSNNDLTSFTLANFQALEVLDLNNNNLYSVRLNNLPELSTLNIQNNQLHSLNVTQLQNLSALNANNNNITKFSVVGLKQLNSLFIENNPVKYLSTGDAPIYKDFEFNSGVMDDISKFIAKKGKDDVKFSIASYPVFLKQMLGIYVQNSETMLDVFRSYAALAQAAPNLPSEIIAKIIADSFGEDIISCLRAGAAEINKSLLDVTNAWYLKDNNYSEVVADFINNIQEDLVKELANKLQSVLYNNQSLQLASARIIKDKQQQLTPNKSFLFSFPAIFKNFGAVAKTHKTKLQLT